jgi:hypothetical protein
MQFTTIVKVAVTENLVQQTDSTPSTFSANQSHVYQGLPVGEIPKASKFNLRPLLGIPGINVDDHHNGRLCATTVPHAIRADAPSNH